SGAGVRLRVETAIQRVFVLLDAFRAHHELLHGRVGPVIGQRLDDRKARAAVRAVGERVAMAAVIRIGNVVQAIRANGEVGQSQPRAMLGNTSAAFSPAESLPLISNPVNPFGSRNEDSRLWMKDRGGLSRSIRSRKLSSRF